MSWDKGDCAENVLADLDGVVASNTEGAFLAT
jgi:hypothetical protein